ncbi:MAG: lipase maturation factor family protein, partial [Opitutaceae bacterium]
MPGVMGNIWLRLSDFAGAGGDATYLWPRWLVLRAVGLVYILVFAGIIEEGQVLVGPHGLIPLASFFTDLHVRFPSTIAAFIQAPSLFWLGTGAGMISALAWLGLLAAVALVLNWWPRMALFGCWVIFLSFVTAWGVWSGSQVDQLMLEVALLCIPFAPAGYRPGLGAASPPRPLVTFMVRWLLFRVMFESGVVKLMAGDPRWRDLTAMDVLYETSPFPTILGYLDHQLPHGYHVLEVALTYTAEIVAPLLAVFGGRRGRWFAFVIWVMFQAGIQLTNNFGWLNTASIAVGLLLLDDQMLASAAAKLRLRRLGERLVSQVVKTSAPLLTPWRSRALRFALWT